MTRLGQCETTSRRSASVAIKYDQPSDNSDDSRLSFGQPWPRTGTSGTITYTTSQDWSLVDGFYFAVATLTASSIADPELTITGWPIKLPQLGGNPHLSRRGSRWVYASTPSALTA